MHTRKVTVVGGSNTVMEPGYFSAVLSQARQKGMHLDIIENMAIGGTTSACGLYRLKTSDALERSDILIIEYALNDAFIYGDERRPFKHWARLYEGLIRHALEKNPALIVCSLVFGSKNGTWLNAIPSIDAGIAYLSDWYGTAHVDVSRTLVRRYGRDVVTDPQFYVDQGHYARPIATGMVAEIVVDTLLDAIAEGPRHGALPPPIDEQNFAGAGTVTAHDLGALAPELMVNHANRRFSFDAFEPAGSDICFDLKQGKLLAVLYVCEPETGAMAVTHNGSVTHTALMKSGVRKQQFRFLAAMVPCDFIYGPRLLADDTDTSFRLSVSDMADAANCHVPKDSVIHEKRSGRPVLPILGFMHSGTLHNLRIEPRSAALNEIAGARLEEAAAGA